MGNTPFEIAITPDSQTAYVTTDLVVPIDLATQQVGTGISVGNFPVNITLTPDGQTLYVTNPFNNTVIPIDTAPNQPGTPIPVENDPVSIVVTPDQAPVASFAVAAASVGGLTSFDARASRSPVGTIASYAWDFGDGSAVVITSSPMITHIYQAFGNYRATLTVTNSAGTSTTKVLTRGTISRNGGPSAISSQMVSISMPTPLPLAPSDFDVKVIKNVFATQTEYIHHLTWKPSPDRSVVKYKFFRNEHLIKKVSTDGPFVFNDHNRKKHQKDRYTLVAINAQGVKISRLAIVVR